MSRQYPNASVSSSAYHWIRTKKFQFLDPHQKPQHFDGMCGGMKMPTSSNTPKKIPSLQSNPRIFPGFWHSDCQWPTTIPTLLAMQQRILRSRKAAVTQAKRSSPIRCSRVPFPPLANSHVSARRSPEWGGGDGRQVTVSQGGGGGDCKGISRQTNTTVANTCAPSVREWYRTWSPGENILGLK